MLPVQRPQIAVLGLGYVGCVSAACLSATGYSVSGVDRDGHKVRMILNHQVPFYEPGLEELVRDNVAAGRLSASTSLEEGIRDADIALICVGTPSERNGNLQLEQLRRVLAEIAQCLPGRSKPLIVAVRSTVFPGTCEELVVPALDGRGSAPVDVVFNPEFLREGTAVKDFLEPSLVVVGGSNPEAIERVAGLYASLGVTASLVSFRTAEMIKYTCNAFHALKVAFANEIGTLSANLGIDAHEVMHTFCQDVRLNISPAYLKPGFAFGGSCLPKDLRALIYRARSLDLELPLLESTLPSNRRHLERLIQSVLDLPVERIGVIGLAFKEDTDDLRESPVVALLESLIGKGRQVRVFDAHVRLEAIYGENRKYILQTIPHIGRLLDSSIDQTLEWAQHLVIAQKQSGEILERIRASNVPTLDLVTVGTPAVARQPLQV